MGCVKHSSGMQLLSVSLCRNHNSVTVPALICLLGAKSGRSAVVLCCAAAVLCIVLTSGMKLSNALELGNGRSSCTNK